MNVAILGSTGSIGRQTLEIAAEFPEEIQVVGLAAGNNRHLLARQGSQFPAAQIALGGGGDAEGSITGASEALINMATSPNVDLVVVAISGAAGLLPTLAALEAGKRVALANKEALVMAGPVIKEQLKHSGELVPIDSEHSAVWQCLRGEDASSVERMVLTASGGAFRDWSSSDLDAVTPEQALNHPTWSMGPKITIDSATLMNKGLEVIEAALLFDVTMDDVSVIMHRESIIHSLVFFSDSSVKAQLGVPDMRQPIQYALGYPNRWPNKLPRLDLESLGKLHFEKVEEGRYPCLELAISAGHSGGTYPAALCAADEVAVKLFLTGRIKFTDISTMVEEALNVHNCCQNPVLADILQADAAARAVCLEMVRADKI